MAFEIKKCYEFGTGKLGDFEILSGETIDNLNSYAPVLSIAENILTIDTDNTYTGRFENFDAGTDILIHASASDKNESDKLGEYICAKIVSRETNTLTLDKNIEVIFTNADLENYCIQAVTFANFKNLTINEGGVLTCPAYSQFIFIGGILALKCSETLNLAGGNISLTDCGISLNWKDKLRPLTEQEILGEKDSDIYAGKENLLTAEKFLLNAGDGAAFICAKKIVSHETSRIGNPKTHGKKFCRGAVDSKYKPANITNVGGSTILIAAEKINASAKLLAKYRNVKNVSRETETDEGKGLARCFIATENLLAYDEKLYHADFISDVLRLKKNFGLRDFGTGKFGDLENPNFKLNCFARIFFKTDNKIYIHKKISNALADFSVGRKIVCFSDRKFCLAEILAVEGKCLTLDKKISAEFFAAIALPEFENFTLTQNFDKNYFAIMVKNNCNISARIKTPCLIVAKNLNVSGGAFFEKQALIVAENVSRETDIKDLVTEDSFLFVGE